MSSKKLWRDEELTCKPLDSYHEIVLFLDNPPPWRTLCKELTTHSDTIIKNIELCNNSPEPTLDTPRTFCHFDPDAENVKRHNEKKLPKALVCHDMANGYHDDSIIDGTSRYDAYTFYNWAGIDIFCYFSHHLITIPPLGWINVGHAHGVKVIGTVITEWADGVAFWDTILASEDKYQEFGSALVTIANTLKFDGWLLNIENKISKPTVLLQFVRYLHKILHEQLPHAVLIWYDSVTITGSLAWQNGLNEKNKDFFDASDGFFTNYSWTEKNIADSVLAAGDRLVDLYVGMDVWGRNFHGGGQFNTQEAVKVAYSAGCSLAIFAPAWTHEAISPHSDLRTVGEPEPADRFARFLLRDRAFWDSLWPFLNTRLPTRLPFQTSFCRGQGVKRRLYGEVLCPGPWFNLRHMQYQPNAAHGPHGYVFTTLDNLIQVSRKALTRDATGIIKYRESFLATRMELHSIKSKTCVHDERASLTAVEEEDEDTVNETERIDEGEAEKPRTVKRKMKNAFRHLFHLKTRKTEEDANKEEEVEDDDRHDEPGPSWASGRSLMAVSMNINLGGKAQRTRWEMAAVPEEKECLELYHSDSFTGGACLRINPSDELSPEHRFTRLFFCDFLCEDSLIVCVVTKNLMSAPDQSLNVVLFMENAKGQDLQVSLIGRSVLHRHSIDCNTSGTVHLYPLDTNMEEFKAVQKFLLLDESGFYVPVQNSYNWIVRYFEVPVAGARVTAINCRTGQEQGSILLGHLGLCNRRRDTC